MSLFLWIEPLFFLAAYVWERFTRENILTVACVVIALSLVRIVYLFFIFMKSYNEFRKIAQSYVANLLASSNPYCAPTVQHQQQYEKEQQEEVDEDLFSEL